MTEQRKLILAAAIAMVCATIIYRRFLDDQLQLMHNVADRLELQHERHLEEIAAAVSGGRQGVNPPVSVVERTHEGPTIMPEPELGPEQMTAAQPPAIPTTPPEAPFNLFTRTAEAELAQAMEELEIKQHRERGIQYPPEVAVIDGRPVNPDLPGPVGDDGEIS